MMKFIFGIIVFFALMLILLLRFGFKLLSLFFNPFKNSENKRNQSYSNSQNNNPEEKSKIFEKNEGEYVDFEEIETSENNEKKTSE